MKFLSFRKKSSAGGRAGSSPTAVMQAFGSKSTSLGSRGTSSVWQHAHWRVPHVNMNHWRSLNRGAAHKFYLESIAEHTRPHMGPGVSQMRPSNVANYMEHQWSRHPYSQIRHDQQNPNAITPEEVDHHRMIHMLRLRPHRPAATPENAREAKRYRAEERRLLAHGVMPNGYEWERSPPENYFRAMARNARPGLRIFSTQSPPSAQEIRAMLSERERKMRFGNSPWNTKTKSKR